MSLKELTAHNHALAEQTPFMKAIFAGTMPKSVWTDWLFNKIVIYSAIEELAEKYGLLDTLPGIERRERLCADYKDMRAGPFANSPSPETSAYYRYLKSLDSADRVMAHLYTWHLGDLYGGQMIKKLVDAPSRSLEFDDADMLKQNIRSMINDSMGAEANCAFEWAIKILNEYTMVDVPK